MGEAKRRAEQGPQPVHFTKREQFTLIQCLVLKPSKDREERRKRKHLWNELGLEAAVKKFCEIGPKQNPGDPPPAKKIGLDIVDWLDDATPIKAILSGPTADFLLEQLNTQLEGPVGEILCDVEDRLLALREGVYELPESLQEARPAPAPADERARVDFKHHNAPDA